MLDKLKSAVKKYDKWCEEMGLTREQSRCCVPIKKEEQLEQPEDNEARNENDAV